MINHDTSRGQSVKICDTYSTFAIPMVDPTLDSGNYTCAPHNLEPDSIVVHILRGEEDSAAAIADKSDSESPAINSARDIRIGLELIAPLALARWTFS